MSTTIFSKMQSRRESGFTLIELLTVIVIIGILAAIAIPVFTSQRQRAQDARSVSEARSVMTALETNAAGSAGGVIIVKSSTVPSFNTLVDNGATIKDDGDALTTYVTFLPGGYVVTTANTAGKATKNAATVSTTSPFTVDTKGNTATFSQQGSYVWDSNVTLPIVQTY